jgi:hypothetical protein
MPTAAPVPIAFAGFGANSRVRAATSAAATANPRRVLAMSNLVAMPILQSSINIGTVHIEQTLTLRKRAGFSRFPIIGSDSADHPQRHFERANRKREHQQICPEGPRPA